MHMVMELAMQTYHYIHMFKSLYARQRMRMNMLMHTRSNDI